jgi:hypothetical protein
MNALTNSISLLVGKPQDESPLGGPISRWEDNIQTDLKGTGLEIVDWELSDSRQEQVMGSCELHFVYYYYYYYYYY